MIETLPNLTGELVANVDADAIVEEDGNLHIRLTIEAENRTSQLIHLDEKYTLPVRRAFDVNAEDDQGALTAHHIEGRIEVEFRKDEKLSPGQKYKWEISFGTPGCFEISEGKNIILGPYLIKPQRTFKKIPIQKHKFNTYRFIFKKPKPRKWWLLKEIHVIQINNKQTPVNQKKKWNHTECTFASFDVGLNDSMKIHFTRMYRFSSTLLAIVAFISSAIIGAVVHSFFCFVPH